MVLGDPKYESSALGSDFVTKHSTLKAEHTDRPLTQVKRTVRGERRDALQERRGAAHKVCRTLAPAHLDGHGKQVQSDAQHDTHVTPKRSKRSRPKRVASVPRPPQTIPPVALKPVRRAKQAALQKFQTKPPQPSSSDRMTIPPSHQRSANPIASALNRRPTKASSPPQDDAPQLASATQCTTSDSVIDGHPDAHNCFIVDSQLPSTGQQQYLRKKCQTNVSLPPHHSHDADGSA